MRKKILSITLTMLLIVGCSQITSSGEEDLGGAKSNQSKNANQEKVELVVVEEKKPIEVSDPFIAYSTSDGVTYFNHRNGTSQSISALRDEEWLFVENELEFQIEYPTTNFLHHNNFYYIENRGDTFDITNYQLNLDGTTEISKIYTASDEIVHRANSTMGAGLIVDNGSAFIPFKEPNQIEMFLESGPPPDFVNTETKQKFNLENDWVAIDNYVDGRRNDGIRVESNDTKNYYHVIDDRMRIYQIIENLEDRTFEITLLNEELEPLLNSLQIDNGGLLIDKIETDGNRVLIWSKTETRYVLQRTIIELDGNYVPDYPNKTEIMVNGSLDFQEEVETALSLLEEKAPLDYRRLQRFLANVEESDQHYEDISTNSKIYLTPDEMNKGTAYIATILSALAYKAEAWYEGEDEHDDFKRFLEEYQLSIYLTLEGDSQEFIDSLTTNIKEEQDNYGYENTTKEVNEMIGQLAQNAQSNGLTVVDLLDLSITGSEQKEILAVFLDEEGSHPITIIEVYGYNGQGWDKLFNTEMEFIYGQYFLDDSFLGDSTKQVMIGGTDGGAMLSFFFLLIGSKDGKTIEILYDAVDEHYHPVNSFEMDGDSLVIYDEEGIESRLFWNGTEMVVD
ncbi:hypothetical protein [Halalkalibacter okhensis]|uniref:Lipoprotein n=1 Tax=Halalkalibacter okhensis TaxID=333138 RepID=A0A0B0IEI5_9BACI|nr:hypothetical protein [Halalkalibacter okhensis]KHF38459.1 hypothetical protein LQ50_21255 [Halalkalibacter okhensis]